MKVDMSIRTLKGHPRGASSVAMTQDGQYIISGGAGYDKVKSSINIWVFKNGNLLKSFKNVHSGGISSIVLSHTGEIIVSSSYDKTIKIWAFSSGKCLKRLKGFNVIPKSIIISPNGKYLVGGFDDGNITIWKIKSGKLKSTHKISKMSINALAMTYDSKILVTGSGEGIINLWKFSKKELEMIQKLTDHEGSIWSLSISPDGRLIASGGEDKTIRIWELLTGIEVNTLKDHPGRVYSVNFSPDGKNIVSGSAGISKTDPNYKKDSNDYAIRIWSVSTGKLVGKLEGHAGDVHSVLVTPDGKYVVSAASSVHVNASPEINSIKIWDFSKHYIIERKVVSLEYCPFCNEKIVEDSPFCPNCGNNLNESSEDSQEESSHKICQSCGTKYFIGVEICEKCGHKLVYNK